MVDVSTVVLPVVVVSIVVSSSVVVVSSVVVTISVVVVISVVVTVVSTGHPSAIAPGIVVCILQNADAGSKLVSAPHATRLPVSSMQDFTLLLVPTVS